MCYGMAEGEDKGGRLELVGSNGFEDCGRSSLHCKAPGREPAAETQVVCFMERLYIIC